MKNWTEQVITVGVTAGVLLLFVVGVHLPRQRARDRLREQIRATEQTLTEAQQRCAALGSLTRQVEGLRAAAASFDERLPEGSQVGPFLKQIAEQLRQANLASLEMRPASPTRAKGYTDLPIRIGFAGSFSNIYTFLANLEGLARVKRIEDLTVETSPEAAGTVRASMTLSIYCTKG